jgi:putative transposase
MKKIKSYSNAYKFKVVLEALQEDESIAKIASTYGITSKNIHNWKKHFLANAPDIFSPDKVAKQHKQALQALEDENDALAKKLGKTTIEKDWLSKKLNSSVSKQCRYELIDNKGVISKYVQCKLLELNRSSHYYQAVGTSDHDIQIMDRIEQIHESISACYGYRNIYQQLQQEGYTLGKNKVLKLMNNRGIKAIYPHKKINTSVKNSEHKIYKYLLKEFINDNKQIVAKYPNHIWSGDISYIKINGGYMYLAAVIDWHSRCILSWKLSNTMDATLVTQVLQDAIDKYGTPEIFNSDQGSQYTSRIHTTLLNDNNIKISMNGKGRSIDNIIIERFFRSIKYECVYINEYSSVKQLRKDIGQYMHFYNVNRFHSSLNYRKPQEVYLQIAA